jgi:DNA segregation ATPase FtsK/SpoIIIE, S-DNA-T family
MKLLGPTPIPRLNEVGGVVYLFVSIFLSLSLVSYHSTDPSWNTATRSTVAGNLTGSIGSHLADLLLQGFGLSSFLLPLFCVLIGWKWIRSQAIDHQLVRGGGAMLLLVTICGALSLLPAWRFFDGVISPGGVAGLILSDLLIAGLNLTGAILVLTVTFIVSLYLISSFSISGVPEGVENVATAGESVRDWWQQIPWPKRRRKPRDEDGDGEDHEPGFETEAGDIDESLEERARKRAERMALSLGQTVPPPAAEFALEPDPPITDYNDEPPFETTIVADEESASQEFEIPIRTLADEPPPHPDHETVGEAGFPQDAPRSRLPQPYSPPVAFEQAEFRLPPTDLLTEPQARNPYDEEELKGLAATIKSKFEEFNVFGSVVQINHGPVVTTFEFKPEAGVKYSKITNLTDDLCLGLQAESILIERIPGRPTVGIEVPNSKREVISLRQVLESDEFHSTKARLPIPLGKDVDGRIKVTALEKMPHLLIAGSTGSGKSVMLNSLLMSVLYSTKPDQVRMILVDPKRVELGIYEDIPHLLTPVITDPRKATNALRNAVEEMERRYKLLASLHVRNLEQYNKKVRKMMDQPRSLFPEAEDAGQEELRPLPYILIVIDELADLMMLERANVESAVARLSQMARAVGLHLVLATQRPSVDVLTGLIKNNLPARISFRVATRFDSRTIIDIMGAERLLGKGDMLFLPPGSSRLIRMHGAYVDEDEISDVVEFWKQQAQPEYDDTFLLAPPSDDDESDAAADDIDNNDPMYEKAVKVVLEMGKASTSILQRRLRIGYGRAARLLDVMQREGIIGPPDGSRPREVLKAPDWLDEVEQSLR